MTGPTDPRIGSDFLGYRVEALLGRSRLSVVYRAEHLRLKRKVALKLLAPELGEDELFRDRFLRESELAASLDHPHIVPIYDAGEVDGQLYIAMRYVEGGDLAKLLQRQGSLPPDHALTLLGQVADALDAAHEAGLVHRDVKPGNVLLDVREHCYLSDFGLARESTARSGIADSGQIVGTVDYVAPEVVAGEEITVQADLYGLGCVLYEMLAGVPPFRRDSEFAVLWSHVNEPPPRISARGAELGALDGVIARALAKDPRQRYASGEALVEAATAALPASVAAPQSWRRRRVVLAVGVLGAAVAAFAVSLALGGGERAPATPTLTPTTTSLQRIDPRTNEIVATIPVAVQSRLVTTGGGSVWAANAGENRLFRIDPATNAVVQSIETVNPRGLGYGAGALWVLNADDGIVTRFDARTGAPAEVIPMPPGTGLAEVDSFVTVAGDSVWVQWVVPLGNIVRITRHSGAAEAATIGPATVGKITNLVRSGRHLWALGVDQGHALLRAAVARPESSYLVASGIRDYGAIAADPTGAWVADTLNDRVHHVDAASATADRTVAVGDFPEWIAAGEGGVWVLTLDGTVWRIDPDTFEVVATIPAGENPGGIAVGEGAVWVIVHPSGSPGS